MSLQARLLNQWLRLTEKPQLARATDPMAFRRTFETKARFFFHPPIGTRREWEPLGNGRAFRVTPPRCATAPVILYFHGGGYVFGSPRTHAAMLATLAKDVEAVAFLPEYPLAPEAPYPAAIARAEDAYSALLAKGMNPNEIVLGGDSAGGGLTLALLNRLLAKKSPLPAGVFAFAPLVDMRFSGASFVAKAQSDVVLPAQRAHDMANYYLAGHNPDDPDVSPLNGAFDGAPPVWLAVSDSEILYDDSMRMAARLEEQKVSVTMHVAHDLPHVWPIFHNVLPEARSTLRDLAQWIKGRLRDQASAMAATR